MRDTLERVAGRVNLRIHRGDTEEPDIILLQELRGEGLDDIPGECTPTEDGWIWSPSINLRVVQYGSGRMHVFSRTPAVYLGIPVEEAIL